MRLVAVRCQSRNLLNLTRFVRWRRSQPLPLPHDREEGDAVSRASPSASPPLSPSRPEPLDPPDDPGHDPTDERIFKPLPVSRMKPRDTARLILARYVVDRVSRLRCQAGQFWLWEGGTY